MIDSIRDCVLFNSTFLQSEINVASTDKGSNYKDRNTYGHGWYIHDRQREKKFLPWLLSLGPQNLPLESARLDVIQSYWNLVSSRRVAETTVHVACANFSRLLWHFSRKSSGRDVTSKETWAGIAITALRIALKFEERPEVLWDLPDVWHILPIFSGWAIGNTEKFLIDIECESLKALQDQIDVPLVTQFFDRLVTVGGWPMPIAKQYVSLGHFLLALATFASEDSGFQQRTPSEIATAALVLTVKIINADTKQCFEFYPDRVGVYSGYALKDLQCSMKALANLLRSKPTQASVLSRVFSDWGDHEWQ